MARVTLNIDQGKVVSVIGGQTRIAVSKAGRITEGRVRSNIVSAGRVDTGRMLSGIRSQENAGDPLSPSVTVSSDQDYTPYQEFGTRGAVARPGKFLVWRGKGGKLIFAKRVRGVKPGRFFQDALAALRPSDFT